MMFALTLTVVPVKLVAFTLAPPNTLPAVMLPVAEIRPPVDILPLVILPVPTTTPVPNRILPPVTLPDVLTVVPKTLPLRLAAVTLPDTLNNPSTY